MWDYDITVLFGGWNTNCVPVNSSLLSYPQGRSGQQASVPLNELLESPMTQVHRLCCSTSVWFGLHREICDVLFHWFPAPSPSSELVRQHQLTIVGTMIENEKILSQYVFLCGVIVRHSLFEAVVDKPFQRDFLWIVEVSYDTGLICVGRVLLLQSM